MNHLKNNRLSKFLIKGLFINAISTFLISFVCLLIFSGVKGGSVEGNGAITLVFIFSIAIIGVFMISSLTVFLNLLYQIRSNLLFSLSSFILMPIISTGILLIYWHDLLLVILPMLLCFLVIQVVAYCDFRKML